MDMATAQTNVVKNKIKSGFQTGIGVFFEYETSKIVQINSKRVGIIYRLIQLLIIGYIIGWVMIYKKGYQEFDTITSSVTTKVKGVQFTNLTGTSIGARVWDVADYVVPPQENNAFFITTNAVITNDQKQGECDEDPSVAPCLSDADCPANKPQLLGNGINTGRCVNSTQQPGSKSCEIRAWCPVETDRLPSGKTLFPDAVNFTVLIKNSIEFPKFKVKRRNILEYYNASQLQNCHYDPAADPFCPVFRVGDVLSLAGIDTFGRIADKGGIVAINIEWDCNLDWPISHCNPVYSFSRLDDESTKIAKGWNFRYAHYYRRNDTDYRVLFKAYGVRFVVFVTGKAGKFNIIPLTMNLGSGVALLGIATVLCDMIVLYVLSKKAMYREAKYQTLQGDDAYQIMDEEEDAAAAANASSSDPEDVRRRGRVTSDQSLQSPGHYGATE